MNVKIVSDFDAVLKRARESTFKNLGYIGGVTRKIAQNSIKIDPKPSAPGTPPHSRKGLLKKAILYVVDKDKQSVIIGPTANVVGPAAEPHEHGGEFRGQVYAPRPFMGPALTKTLTKIDSMWKNSIR